MQFWRISHQPGHNYLSLNIDHFCSNICERCRKYTIVRHTYNLLTGRTAYTVELVMEGSKVIVLTMAILGCLMILSQCKCTTNNQMNSYKVVGCFNIIWSLTVPSTRTVEIFEILYYLTLKLC